MFDRVKADTAAHEVKRYVQSVRRARRPSWSAQATVPACFTEHWDQFYTDMPAGRYPVACFWRDDETGMPHVYVGMWKLTTLK